MWWLSGAKDPFWIDLPEYLGSTGLVGLLEGQASLSLHFSFSNAPLPFCPLLASVPLQSSIHYCLLVFWHLHCHYSSSWFCRLLVGAESHSICYLFWICFRLHLPVERNFAPKTYRETKLFYQCASCLLLWNMDFDFGFGYSSDFGFGSGSQLWFPALVLAMSWDFIFGIKCSDSTEFYSLISALTIKLCNSHIMEFFNQNPFPSLVRKSLLFSDMETVCLGREQKPRWIMVFNFFTVEYMLYFFYCACKLSIYASQLLFIEQQKRQFFPDLVPRLDCSVCAWKGIPVLPVLPKPTLGAYEMSTETYKHFLFSNKHSGPQWNKGT